MIINSIHLKNFRNLDDVKINLSKGLNLISGPNGSGKSSIMLGFSFLTLGHTLKKIGDYARWGKPDFYANTEIDFLGKKFNISYENGSKLATIDSEEYKKSAVGEALEEYFDPTLCKAAFLSFQGEMDIITSTPAVRRDILKKIYDLTFSEEIIIIEKEIAEIKETNSLIQKKIDFLNQKEYSFKEILDQIFSKDVFNEKTKEKNNLNKLILVEEQLLKEYLEKQNRYEKLKIDLNNSQKRLTEKEDKLKNSLSELDDLRNKKFDESKLISLKKDLSEQPPLKRIVSFKKDEEISSLEENRRNLDLNILKLKDSIELKEKGKCPTCGNPFTSKDVQDDKEKLDVLKEEYDQLTKSLNVLKEEKENYLKQIEENKSLESTIKFLTARIEGEEENLNNQKKSHEESIQRTESIISDLESDVKHSNTQIESFKKEIKSIDLDNKPSFNFEETKQLINSLENELNKYNSIESNNKLIKEQNEEIKKDQEKDKKELEKLSIEIDQINRNISDLESAKEIFRKDFPNYVIKKMISSIEYGMNSFLEKTYNGRYTVSIEESKSGIDILYGPEKVSVSLSSGAERELFNIGMKIAYNRLSGLGSLFLDEVDSQMDLDVAKEVFSAIDEMYRKKLFDQIIVITHKPDIKDMIENEFYAKVFNIQNGYLV